MRKREEELYNDPWDRDFYETGSTRPPKNHGGLVAGLLILVIVLGGVTTCLGLMNIRLFQMLEEANKTRGEDIFQVPSVRVEGPPAQTESLDAAPQPENAVKLGLECITVSTFDRRFYRLPYGCLVTEVLEDSCAGAAGISTGDVIVSLNDQTVQSVEDLDALLEQCHSGEPILLTVYRSRTENLITFEVSP